MATKKTIVFIVGPTGSGKTEAGLYLGKLMPCGFISADAMQVYRGMDIVTDKLPIAVRKAVSYHLLDSVEPAKEYNVAAYLYSARKALGGIIKSKKTPVVIGGTGLYVNALLDGIFEAKAEDPEVRARLEKECERRGVGVLFERLKSLDPEAAAITGPDNARRIIRALEACEVTGRSFSALRKDRHGLREDFDVRVFGLRRSREDLYARIEARVDAMVESGLIDEVRRLLEKKLSKTAYGCIGIREIEGFFKGTHDLKEAIRLIKLHSRHYAKRQMTWFRKTEGVEWIDVAPDEDLSGVARKIAGKL